MGKYIVREYSDGEVAIAFHRECGNQILFKISGDNKNDVLENAKRIVDELNAYYELRDSIFEVLKKK